MKKIYTNFLSYLFSSQMIALTLFYHLLFLAGIFVLFISGPESFYFPGAPAVLIGLCALILGMYYIYAIVNYKHQKK